MVPLLLFVLFFDVLFSLVALKGRDVGKTWVCGVIEIEPRGGEV